MGLVGQVQDDALLCLNAAGAVLGLDEPAGDVGVHAVAGDVLADLIHHQHVALVEEQVGDGLVGDLLELGFLADDLLRAQALDEIGLVVGVLNDGDTAQHRRVFQDRPAVLLHQLVHDAGALMMDALSALLLAKANGHHLHQAAFIGATEGGVGLDAVEEDDTVGFRGILIHIYRLMTHTGNADLHRLHGAFHGAAHGLLRNAVILEDLKLAFGSSAAVTAHSRHNVRLGTLGLDKVYNGTGHHSIVIDAAAAAGNGDLLAGLDLAADLGAIQLPGDDTGNITFRNAGLVEVLADLDHFGDRCVFDQVGNSFHVLLLSRRRRRHIISTIIQIFNLDPCIIIGSCYGLILKNRVCQKPDRMVSLGIRPLIDQKLDGALFQIGRIGICYVEADYLDLTGKAGIVHRLSRTGKAGTANEDTGQIRQCRQLFPHQAVNRIVVAVAIDHMRYIQRTILFTKMRRKSADPLLAGRMQRIDAHHQQTAARRQHLLHQRRRAKAALIGILSHIAIPQSGIDVLVVRNERELFVPLYLKPPADSRGVDPTQGQSLDIACQQ